jgi:hypothetical protein
VERWRRELRDLQDGVAPERPMVLRWYNRRDDSAWDVLFPLRERGDRTFVALFPLEAEVGAAPSLVFPVDDGGSLGLVSQEAVVWVRGEPAPGRAVLVVTATDELAPAGRPRAGGRADPTLVGEM